MAALKHKSMLSRLPDVADAVFMFVAVSCSMLHDENVHPAHLARLTHTHTHTQAFCVESGAAVAFRHGFRKGQTSDAAGRGVQRGGQVVQDRAVRERSE